ncbi:Chromosome transmission fidelity protein 18 [Coemansia sp. RSA 2131]|nr:Chromosome transmission fidelity protein 18 [Coemansia sp. RSA 2131]
MGADTTDAKPLLFGNLASSLLSRNHPATSSGEAPAVVADISDNDSDNDMFADDTSHGLTLLPTAEYSDDDMSDSGSVNDIFSSLNALRNPSDTQWSSQPGPLKGASTDTVEHQLNVFDVEPQSAFMDKSNSDSSGQLSDSDLLDAEEQGRDVANIILRDAIRQRVEEGSMQGPNSIAMFSATERFDAYQQAIQKQTQIDKDIAKRQTQIDNEMAKRQKTEHVSVSAMPIAGPSTVPAPKARTYGLPPETGGFITTRTASGAARYFGVRTELELATRMEQAADIGSVRMSTSAINRMVGDIENDLDTEAALRVSEMDVASQTELPSAKSQHAGSNKLWVDKYRAQSFVDLISDERTNRAVLQWLKEWDYCVFGRESMAAKRGAQSERAPENTDRWKRPPRRILLLSGPPGLGKTTLAHVAARQAGYDVAEINASDDRTVGKVRDRVLGVTQTHTVNAGGQSARPQLLIIDEIDGASAASAGAQGDFISMLVSLAAEGGESKKGGEPKKGRKKRSLALRRPIICICNNVYAPVLRPLRQTAQCYVVHAPTAARLAQRLTEVCAREHVDADQWGLLELAKQNEGDMRACLNALQMASERRRRVDADDLKRGALGLKDMQRSLFSIWEMIFTNATTRVVWPSLGKRSNARATAPAERAHTEQILRSVRASGELERIMQGCFENYLRMEFRDLTHTRVSALCTDWLEFYDAVDHACRKNPAGTDGISGYRDFALLAVHNTCRSALGLSRGGFEYPHSEYAAFQARTTAHGILQTLGSSPTCARSLMPATHVATDLLDPLLRIMSPQLVTSNKHLLKGAERDRMQRLVTVMDAWQLTLVQERDSGSQFVYRLEPPIDRLYAIGSRRPQRTIMPMRYPVRQLIAQELQRVRAARLMGDHVPDNAGAAKRDYLERLFADPLASTQTPTVANTMARDFFGREVSQTSASQAVYVKPARMWFHYFEGFSNAVRKPTQMSELF